MSAHSPDMKELKSLLRGLLISNTKIMTADDLYRDFRKQEGHDIPYRQFGYCTLLDFLRSIPDTVKIESSFGSRDPVITPVLSKKSSHVDALVQKQKVNPPKHGRMRNCAVRRSAIHPSAGRPAVLIPYQLQQRLAAMFLQHPEGIPFVNVEQTLHPSVLRNYGINCSVGELIENLRHIFKVINGRVYLVEGTVNPPKHHTFNSRCNFVPPRVENKFRQTQQYYNDNGDGTWRQKCEMKPGGYEDNEQVQNDDLNVEELNEQEECYEVSGGETKTIRNTTTENSAHDKTGSTPSESMLLINKAVRSNLITLLDNNPDGVLCSELPQLYKMNFKVDLDYRGLGFFSVLQMVSNLPEVFHCIRLDGEDWKVLDARKPLPQMYESHDMKTTTGVYKNTEPHVPTKIKNNIERLLMVNSCGLWSDFFLDKYQGMFGQGINFQQLNFDSLESFLLFLNDEVVHMRYVKGRIMIYPRAVQEPEVHNPLPHISQDTDLFLELYPPEVVGPKDTISQQKLPPDVGPGSYLEVIVAEVYTPQHFWIQLRGEKTHIALDKLMNEIQYFYEQELDYKMPEATVRLNQYCMAPFNEELHRARIIAVPNLIDVQVFFMDYGTKSKVKKSDLRFMHQDFAKFPFQAIRASLANIKPTNGAAKWPQSVSKRFLELVSDRNLVAIVSSADHETNAEIKVRVTSKPLVALINNMSYQNRELELALVDTTGDEDIHINDTLKYEGLADYKRSATTPAAAAPAPPPQQRIETENVAPASRRPPPGFTSVPPAPVFNLGATQPQQQDLFSSLGQSCFVPPAYVNPAFLNPMTAAANQQLWNFHLHQAYLSSLMFGNSAIPALMYNSQLAALANSLGMPMVNPSAMFTPQPEVNVPQVPPQAAEAQPPTSSPNSVKLGKSEMNIIDFPCTSETESEKTVEQTRKTSNSTSSSDSSGFDVVSINTPVRESEILETEQASEDSEELFRSDDEDATVESLTEHCAPHEPAAESLPPVFVKKVEMAKQVIHVVNIQSVAYLCTEEVVHLFTEFSGRHVILKILDAKGVIIPFREVSRRESPEIIKALEVHDVVGLRKSFIAGTLMGKIHLTPLLSMPQLLTVLNVRNREVFRAVQEEIDRFNNEKFYWTTTR